jgi:catecholate siderophore receptor
MGDKVNQSTNFSVKKPLSLRGVTAFADPGMKLAVACLAGAAWSETAQAEDAALPALTVDAPAQRHRASPPKPSPAHQRARASLRQIVRHQAAQPAARPSALQPRLAAPAP